MYEQRKHRRRGCKACKRAKEACSNRQERSGDGNTTAVQGDKSTAALGEEDTAVQGNKVGDKHDEPDESHWHDIHRATQMTQALDIAHNFISLHFSPLHSSSPHSSLSGFDSSHVFCFIVHCTDLLVINATWTRPPLVRVRQRSD